MMLREKLPFLAMIGALSMPLGMVAQDKVLHDSIAEVTIRGNEKAKDYRSVAPVYTIGTKDFERMGLADMAMALRRLPGLFAFASVLVALPDDSSVLVTDPFLSAIDHVVLAVDLFVF